MPPAATRLSIPPLATSLGGSISLLRQATRTTFMRKASRLLQIPPAVAAVRMDASLALGFLPTAVVPGVTWRVLRAACSGRAQAPAQAQALPAPATIRRTG